MRRDGKRVKNLDPIHGIMPHLMNNRCDAEIYYTEKVDVTDLLEFLEKKNKGKDKRERITLFHTIIFAMAQTIYNRPLLNRFICGRKYYDRNEMVFGFVAKNKFEDDAEERLIILKATEEMQLADISEYVLKSVSKTREAQSNDINDILGFVTKLPAFLLALIMNTVKGLNYLGIAPKFVTEGDSNFTTVLLSNLGSIGADCCYHHLNNYGTNSIMSTIGVIHEETIDGKVRKVINMGFTVDERIADGFYFVNSIKILKYILENPKYLEEKVATKIEVQKK